MATLLAFHVGTHFPDKQADDKEVFSVSVDASKRGANTWSVRVVAEADGSGECTHGVTSGLLRQPRHRCTLRAPQRATSSWMTLNGS